MSSITATLRSMRYFDRLIIRGKRMVMGQDHVDPCNYIGHEEVLGFLTAYCNDRSVTEDSFMWTVDTVGDLEHVKCCEHCMARVFSVPGPHLNVLVNHALAS